RSHVTRLCRVVYLAIDKGRVDVAGADGIAADAEGGAFERNRFSHAEQAVFRRDVGALEGRGDQRVGRRNVDDAPPFLLLHAGEREARRVEGRVEVQVDDEVPLVDREVLDR